jgi:predicted aspartyl protease
VFDLELNTEQMAARLVRTGHGPWTTMDEEVLEAILYDAMIALREQMLDEAE